MRPLFSFDGRVYKEGLRKLVRLLDLRAACCLGSVTFSSSLETCLDCPGSLLLLLPTVVFSVIGLRAVDGFLAMRTGALLTLIELPIREVLLELIRLAELDVDGFGAAGTDGFLTLMELPIREVVLELIRLAELAAGGFATVGTDGLLTLMELPIREVLLWLI